MFPLLSPSMRDTISVSDVIWFSRDVHQSQLQRWMIAVQSVRTTFTRQADGSYRLETYTIPGWTPEGENEQTKRPGRNCSYESHHFLQRIAYTRLLQHQIAECFYSIRSQYPTNFSWTQCQDFLRRFVTGILDQPSAQWPWPYSEWQWFLDNTDTSRHQYQDLPPIPHHVIAALRTQQQQQQNQNSTIPSYWFNMLNGANRQVQQQNLQNSQGWT